MNTAIKVLIVEDNPVARALLGRVVTESFSDPILVSEAGDLETARQLIGDRASSTPAENESFKLTLVDLELPDGNGMVLLQELAEHPALKIATTLYSDDDHLFPALQCGADGYLLKENRFEQLVEALQKIVRGQPALSPAIARRALAHFRSGNIAPNAPDKADAIGLAPRETEALTYLSKGFTLTEIANLMGIKAFAVNDHIKAVYGKLDASGRAARAGL